MSINCKTGETEFSRGLSVFPNPSSGNFTFSTSMLDADGEIEIHDLAGALVEKIMFTAGEDVTGSRNIPEGVYIALIRADNTDLQAFKIIRTQ